jgi:acetyltransferase-like isoleucine patch superfamily enzyme
MIAKLLSKFKKAPAADYHVDPSAQILGLQAVRIGTGSVISEHCWLNVNPPHDKEVAIDIGRYCLVGRRNFFTSGSAIVLGDYFLSGPDCSFLGADHGTQDPFQPYISQPPVSRGEIRIGSNVWLGAKVQVLAPATIGFGAVVGAGSIVLGDLPPLAIAVGTPARVIKRYSIAAARWVPVGEFQDEPLPTEAEYLEKLRSSSRPRIPVIASGSSHGSR